jgi:hypothetical protein
MSHRRSSEIEDEAHVGGNRAVPSAERSREVDAVTVRGNSAERTVTRRSERPRADVQQCGRLGSPYPRPRPSLHDHRAARSARHSVHVEPANYDVDASSRWEAPHSMTVSGPMIENTAHKLSLLIIDKCAMPSTELYGAQWPGARSPWSNTMGSVPVIEPPFLSKNVGILVSWPNPV